MRYNIMDGLAREVKRFELGIYCHRIDAPPIGTDDENIVILRNITEHFFQLGTRLCSELSLCFFDTNHIILVVGLDGINLKHIRVNCVFNKFCDNFGVAFFKAFDCAVYIILSASGIVDN